MATLARAHDGPPFPILVDRPVGPYIASVWTDPDIGTGTFHVILEPQNGGAMPARTAVRVAVQPVSKRLAEAVFDAAGQPTSGGERHDVEVLFAEGGMWRVRILVHGSEGGGELEAEVEPTPAGDIGPIGLVVYLIPFLAVGFLWIKGALRRREPRQV